jgi:hypothetical protein
MSAEAAHEHLERAVRIASRTVWIVRRVAHVLLVCVLEAVLVYQITAPRIATTEVVQIAVGVVAVVLMLILADHLREDFAGLIGRPCPNEATEGAGWTMIVLDEPTTVLRLDDDIVTD